MTVATVLLALAAAAPSEATAVWLLAGSPVPRPVVCRVCQEKECRHVGSLS